MIVVVTGFNRLTCGHTWLKRPIVSRAEWREFWRESRRALRDVHIYVDAMKLR